MQTIHVLDVKPFMQLLFQSNQIDTYSFVSGQIQTDMSYQLDGHRNPSFFDEAELELLDETNCTYLPWSIAKDRVFQIIKGKKTPSLLKIVLRASNTMTEELLSTTNSSLKSNDIDGMFINILFQENALNVICGISYKIFTLDKGLEQEFQDKIITLFKSSNISCKTET